MAKAKSTVSRSGPKPIVIGNVYGRLKVVGYAGQNKHGKRLWACVCENDGNAVVAIGSQLNNGKTKSCGCLRGGEPGSRNYRHGGWSLGKRTPEYMVWGTMIQRCENPNNKKYGEYGGRGIRVCDRWRNSFAHFLEDMGERPSKHYQLDRIDNDGNYEPGNCRWATRRENTQNTRRNHRIEFNGERLTLSEWSRRVGLHVDSIRYRLDHGWSVERALTTPIRK